MSKSGVLTLIPIPLQDTLPLEPIALQILEKASRSSLTDENLIVVEETKTARKRWISWGLDRNTIDRFLELNEHSTQSTYDQILSKLKAGKNVYLMSDCGLPAFCDPGQKLVDLCHKNQIPVTATPFPHSVSLAIALSGINCDQFWFEGFLPQKEADRKQRIQKWAQSESVHHTIVFMDTPYRLLKTLRDLEQVSRTLFLAMELNGPEELLLRDTPKSILRKLDPRTEAQNFKKEFIAILAPYPLP